MGKPSEKLVVREPRRAKKYSWDEVAEVASTHTMDEYHRECLMWMLCRVRELEAMKAVGLQGELGGIRARLEDIWAEVKRGEAGTSEGEGSGGESEHEFSSGAVELAFTVDGGAGAGARSAGGEAVRESGDGGGEKSGEF